MGPVCSGGSAGEGKGELDGDGSSSGSSALPRDHSSSVVSLGTPSLPAGPLSLTDLLISGSCDTPVLGSSHLVAVNATSDAELQTEISIEIPLPIQSYRVFRFERLCNLVHVKMIKLLPNCERHEWKDRRIVDVELIEK